MKKKLEAYLESAKAIAKEQGVHLDEGLSVIELDDYDPDWGEVFVCALLVRDLHKMEDIALAFAEKHPELGEAYEGEETGWEVGEEIDGQTFRINFR